jgi:GT2 family glycosyltransferase
MEHIISVCLVVIAGRDANNLERLLSTVRDLSKKPDELIVVYDIKQCKKSIEIQVDGVEIKSIEYIGDGKQPHMRNLALMQTNCDYVWYIDDDVSLEYKSCEKLYKVLEDLDSIENLGAIGGRIIEDKGFDRSKIIKPIEFNFIKGPIGLFDIKSDEFPNSLYEVIEGGSGRKYPVIDFCQGTSMVFKRTQLKKIGGFDEDLGIGYSSFEDSEPGFAFKKNNVKTIYSGDFSLTHHKLPRIGGVSRGNQQFEYNKFLVRNCIISLIKNSYPDKKTMPFYLAMFCMVQFGRCLKENLQNKDANPFVVVIKSVVCISEGVFLGVGASIKSKFKRINSSK